MKPERKTYPVRIWQQVDIEEIRSHLMLIDDLYGMCASCKQLGLNYLKDKTCPKCGNEFRYIASSLKSPADTAKLLARIESEKLPFTLIDREDYDRATSRDAISGLFQRPE